MTGASPVTTIRRSSLYGLPTSLGNNTVVDGLCVRMRSMGSLAAGWDRFPIPQLFRQGWEGGCDGLWGGGGVEVVVWELGAFETDVVCESVFSSSAGLGSVVDVS